MLTMRQIAKLAFQDILAAAQRGDLAVRDYWTLAKGSDKYRRAVASGDVADDDVQAIRAECNCEHCDARTDGDGAKIDGHDVRAHYCGPIGKDLRESVLPSCGCLCAVTIDGKFLAAGKTLVKSEKCPRGHW